MQGISASGHSGKGEKEVHSVIEVWEFPGHVPNGGFRPIGHGGRLAGEMGKMPLQSREHIVF
jgi:hypothetical protein